MYSPIYQLFLLNPCGYQRSLMLLQPNTFYKAFNRKPKVLSIYISLDNQPDIE